MTPSLPQMGFAAAQASSSRPLLSHTPSRSALGSGTSLPKGYPMHAGCVLCSLVASAQAAFASSSSNASGSQPQGSSHDPYSAAVQSPQLGNEAEAFSPSSTPNVHPYPQPFSPDPQSSFAQFGENSTSGAAMAKGKGRGVRVEGRDVLYGDEDITVYAAEGKEALRQDGGQLIIVVNRHMESVNEMVSASIRPLVDVLKLTDATRGHLISRCYHI